MSDKENEPVITKERVAIFSPQTLQSMTGATGFTVWAYSTSDRLDSVLADNYFQQASTTLRYLDVIAIKSTNKVQGGLLLAGVTAVEDNLVIVQRLAALGVNSEKREAEHEPE